MSLIILTPLAFSSSPTVLGIPLGTDGLILGWNVVADYGSNIKLSDAIVITLNNGGGANSSGVIFFYFEDPGVGAFPAAVTINSVKLQVVHSASVSSNMSSFTAMKFDSDQAGAVNFDITDDSLFPFISQSATVTTNSVTGNPFRRLELFNDGDAGSHGNGVFSIDVELVSTIIYTIDQFRLIVDYTGLTITSVTPNSGGMFGGASVAIHGSGFSGVTITRVLFGGVPATNVFVLSDTVLSCDTPAHAAGPVFISIEVTDPVTHVVTTTTSLTTLFTYLSPFTFLNPLTAIRPGDKVKFEANTSITATGLPSNLRGILQVVLDFPGNQIIINTGINGTDPFLTINDVIYYWLDFVIMQTAEQFWFYLPFGFRSYQGPVTITFVGDGTQFSGSVLAGTLQILFEDASGIYVLDKNQTNDLLYFRDGFTTDLRQLFLPSLLNDNELLGDDFFSAMSFPTRILTENNLDESPVDDSSDDNFLFTAVLRIPVTTLAVEIPSPFIKTAFLP